MSNDTLDLRLSEKHFPSPTMTISFVSEGYNDSNNADTPKLDFLADPLSLLKDCELKPIFYRSTSATAIMSSNDVKAAYLEINACDASSKRRARTLFARAYRVCVRVWGVCARLSRDTHTHTLCAHV